MNLRTYLSPEQKAWILRVLYWPCFPRDWLFCRWHGFNWDPGWRLRGLPLVQRAGAGSRISIGRAFNACSDPRHNVLGVFQRVVIKTSGVGACVVIGNDVGISGCTISAARSITIGDRVLIGSGCLITDGDAHPIDPAARRAGSAGAVAPVVIEDDVFIGARAIILKGVTIGRGSVVGAGSVVTKSVPAFSVAAGNPARVVGSSRRLATQTEPGSARSGVQQ